MECGGSTHLGVMKDRWLDRNAAWIRNRGALGTGTPR